MSLSTYKAKRNFSATPEPEGKVTRNKTLSFVVQRHHASHLHYDFRLEMDGVLKSWAVPKGPSLNPKDKRLAMMVEDHPFDYLDFEGEIPEGNYGAGTVQIWDIGTYEIIKSSATDTGLKQIAKGSIKIRMSGKKLKGEFALVKLKDDKGKGNSWLLIKHADEYSTKEPYTAEDYIKKTVSKKTPTKKPVGSAVRKKADTEEETAPVRKKHSRFDYEDAMPAGKKQMLHTPMLAYLTETIPSSDEYVFEEKYDGYRALAEIENKTVSLYSRNHKSFDTRFNIVVRELKKLNHTAVLDGELVVINSNSNKITFDDIQNVDSADEKNIRYVLFDILSLDGEDVTGFGLEQRRELLTMLLKKNKSPHILLSPVYNEGEELFAKAKKDKLEGIIAKRKESAYLEGVRSRDWLKVKINNTQDAIICGYTKPQGSRSKFGSLVLAMLVKGKLTYIGNCGTGFNEQSLKSVYTLLQARVTNEKPFPEKVEGAAAVTWVRPEIICEVKYSEWTAGNHLRHPVFMRIRDDKPLEEAIKEVKVKADAKKSTARKMAEPPAGKKKVAAKTKTAAGKKSIAKQSIATSSINDEKQLDLKVGKVTLSLTNLSKIYWPKEKYTKGDLLRYYDQVADYILPYLKNRALSLNRFPNGISGESFYQKDIDTAKSPSWLKTEQLYSESNDKHIDYLVCNDKATLLYMANLGCIEMNPWLSRISNIDHPDFMVLDLDPGKIGFSKVIDTAQACREVLDGMGVPSFIKTSGSTGLHIYVHLNAKYDFDISKMFAQLISQKVQAMLPEFTSIERSVSKRPDKIYIDFLQNRRGQTIASAFSCRPKPGATVSFPLHWKEVTHSLKISDYTIFNVPDILASSWKNPWNDIFKHEVNVKNSIRQLDQ